MKMLQETAVLVQIRLIAVECCSCGVVFGLSEDLKRKRQEDHHLFWCPNGHQQYFSGETATEKALREHAESLAQQLRWEAEARSRAESGKRHAENSLRTTKGHVTRLQNRAKAGLCPYGCHRHFENLERHIASKHAKQTLELDTDTDTARSAGEG